MTTERTWGPARDELVTLLKTALRDLPRVSLSDGKREYVPHRVVPVIEKALQIVENELRPRIGQRGARVFGPLDGAGQAHAIHLHMDGLNNAQIARELDTSEGQVGNVIREWRGPSSGHRVYWPDANPERVFCACAFHNRKRRTS